MDVTQFIKEFSDCFHKDHFDDTHGLEILEKLTPKEFVTHFSPSDFIFIFHPLNGFYFSRCANVFLQFFKTDFFALLSSKEWACFLIDLFAKGNISLNKLSEEELYYLMQFIDFYNLYDSQLKDIPLLFELSHKKKQSILEYTFSKEFYLWFIRQCFLDDFAPFLKNSNRIYDIMESIDFSGVIDRILAGEHIELNPDFVREKVFFDFLPKKDLIVLRDLVNRILNTNPSYLLEERMERYLESLLAIYDEQTDLFIPYKEILEKEINISVYFEENSYYFNKDEFKRFKKYMGERPIDKERHQELFWSLTKLKLSEIIVDLLFKDNIVNVKLNIKEILRYHSSLKEPLLSEERIKFYKAIKNIDKMSNSEKMTLFKEYKNQRVHQFFYEDLRMLKDYMYAEINKCLFKVSEARIDEKLSEDLGVPVIDMRGKEFYSYARCLNEPFRKYFAKCYNSHSLISYLNIRLFDKSAFKYGYEELDGSKILEVYEDDLASKEDLCNGLEVGTSYVNRLLTPKELVMLSQYYNNEIMQKNELKDEHMEHPNPQYLICLDGIYEKDAKEAKRLGIPIILAEERQNVHPPIELKDVCYSYQSTKYCEEDETQKKRMKYYFRRIT